MSTRPSVLPHLALLGLAPATFASAHDGTAAVAGSDWLQWTGNWWVAGAIAITAILYARGCRRHARSAPLARNYWPQWAWWTGWLALTLALLSPLDTLGAELFSAHMVQHELLMLVAAPLLVMGRPLAMFAWALPASWATRVGRIFRVKWWRQGWRWLTLPAIAWLLHAVALWTWHIPSFFEAGLRSAAIHDVQHVSFFGTALLFWWALVRRRRRAETTIHVFTTLIHTGMLGMLLTFATTPWYPFYAQTAPFRGLTPLEDQQLGGLIMWVPSGALLVIAGLLLVHAWLRHMGRVQSRPVEFVKDP